MTDRPIIFSAPMVRALLEGRKTQTRRVVRQPQAAQEWYHRPDNGRWCIIDTDPHHSRIHCDLPYRIGDRLYVREAFSYETLDVDRNGFMPPWYWADGNPTSGDFTRPKPSIHMPRWASRLTLTVTDVRVQRLQEISRGNAMEEGCPFPNMAYGPNPRDWFADLWNSLHGPGAWGANPWVVALTFTVQHGNIDQLAAVPVTKECGK